MSLNVDRAALAVLRRLPIVAAVAEARSVPLFDTTPSPSRSDAAPQQGESENGVVADWWQYPLVYENSWEERWYGDGHAVAVIDTGVQSDHPWLGGKVVEEACYSKPGSGVGGFCPNGADSQAGTGAAAPCSFQSESEVHKADCGHGTHVAGIAAGTNGVAPRASIIAIQIFQPNSPGKRPFFETYDVVYAMEQVLRLADRYSIAAVNLSVGDNQSWPQACDASTGDPNVAAFTAVAVHLRSLGIATVAASGNNDFDGGINWPACSTPAVSVGNTTLGCPSREVAFLPCEANSVFEEAVYSHPDAGSNSSAVLSLLAPGTAICSAVPVENPVEPGCDAEGVPAVKLTGTSMASPHVAGAFAVLKQGAVDREIPNDQIVQRSLTALQSSGLALTAKGITRSRIDVWAAVNWLYCGRPDCD